MIASKLGRLAVVSFGARRALSGCCLVFLAGALAFAQGGPGFA